MGTELEGGCAPPPDVAVGLLVVEEIPPVLEGCRC